MQTAIVHSRIAHAVQLVLFRAEPAGPLQLNVLFVLRGRVWLISCQTYLTLQNLENVPRTAPCRNARSNGIVPGTTHTKINAVKPTCTTTAWHRRHAQARATEAARDRGAHDPHRGAGGCEDRRRFIVRGAAVRRVPISGGHYSR